MTKLQYAIKLYDEKQNQTFEQKFYITEEESYLDALLQMIEYLKEFQLEIDPKNIGVMLAVGKNPRETFCLLERVD